jgi:hypothetical protein
MAKKYVATKKKMSSILEWLSGQRKWPKDTDPKDLILSAGKLTGLGSGYQRKRETKLDEIKKFSLGKGERFSTKLDRDRRKKVWVKEQVKEKVDKHPSLYDSPSQKSMLKEKFENEFDRQSLLKGKRNKKGGSVSKYSTGGGVRKSKYSL